MEFTRCYYRDRQNHHDLLRSVMSSNAVAGSSMTAQQKQPKCHFYDREGFMLTKSTLRRYSSPRTMMTTMTLMIMVMVVVDDCCCCVLVMIVTFVIVEINQY